MRKGLILLGILAMLFTPINVKANGNVLLKPHKDAKVTIFANGKNITMNLPEEKIVETFKYTKGGEKIGTVSTSVIVKIDSETNEIEYLEDYDIMPLDSQDNTNTKSYWKANISINYILTNSYINYKNVSGSWTKLSSNAPAITNKEVVYGGMFKDGYPLVTKYPSSNSFSYDTYFGNRPYNYGGAIMANAHCNVGGQYFAVECGLRL